MKFKIIKKLKTKNNETGEIKLVPLKLRFEGIYDFVDGDGSNYVWVHSEHMESLNNGEQADFWAGFNS